MWQTDLAEPVEQERRMPPTRIEQDVVVTIQYKLSLDDGTVVEESTAEDPLMYLHGHDNIIPGLERALAGASIGDHKKVVVESADAYGEYDPDETDEIQRDEWPAEFEPELGMLLSVEDQEGNEYVAQVVDMDGDVITLDYNHPLAGHRLHFDVTVTGLRTATAEELSHGHVHDPHGGPH
jgi:FKBP-type peptidyl-prolyl cis-trans isomerase SlyD